MPVSGNPYGVLRKALQKTLREKLEVHKAVAVAVKELLTDQFAYGIDPYGKPQPPAKRRFTGLVSEKLPRAIKVTPDANGVAGVGELKSSGVSRRRAAQGKVAPPPRPRRQWLMAHQKGHVFPARTVEGQRRFFDAKGKRVAAARFKALTSKAGRRVTIGAREAYWQESKNRARLKGRILNVRRHTIRARVLVPRLIYPEPKMGARWGKHLKDTVGEVLGKRLQRNVERG